MTAADRVSDCGDHSGLRSDARTNMGHEYVWNFDDCALVMRHCKRCKNDVCVKRLEMPAVNL